MTLHPETDSFVARADRAVREGAQKAAVDAPPSCFERDDMSRAARKARAKKRVRDAAKASHRRDAGIGPTPERLAKGDVAQVATGGYRAPPPIERLRDRDKLCPGDRYASEAMFRAAEKLADTFRGAGLSAGAQAQDLNRVVSGSGDAPSGMPLNEFVAAQRQQLRTAIAVMGWWAAFPHRGAARLVMDVVCYEIGLEDAVRVHRPGGNDAVRLGIGMDVLRDGLFALAVHWRMLRG